MATIGKILLGLIVAIPAIEKILNNPAVAKLLVALVGLFVKSEAEKAVDKIKKSAKVHKETKRKMKVAIREAKESRTKKIEDIWNSK